MSLLMSPIIASSSGGGGGGGGIGGTIASGQVAFGSGVDTIAGSSNLTWDNTNRVLTTLGVIASTGTTGSTPVSGAGTRMMWVSAKSAFRAGSVNSTQWDDANIGTGSVAFGQNTTASNSASAAFNNGQATGNTACAINGGTASGYFSFASGTATASSDYTFAGGYSSTASGIYSSAIGYACEASDFYAVAMGSGSTASGNSSVAIGGNNSATNTGSQAYGSGMTVSGAGSVGANLNSAAPSTLSEDNTYGIFSGQTILKSHGNFSGSGRYELTAAVTTTNNTITNLYTKTLSDNSVYYYHVDIVARRSDSGTENGRFTREFLVYRQGGGATLGASTVVPWTDEQLTMAGTITVDTNSNDIRIRVTGETGKTIEWLARIRCEVVSGNA